MGFFFPSMKREARPLIGPDDQFQWAAFHRSRRLSLARRPLFDGNETFFTMGSCFADEIRLALTQRGIACVPDFASIGLDAERVKVDNLPRRNHLNFYNTFSIRQEFERAAGAWTQSADDYWTVPNRILHNGKVRTGNGVLFQDPYRRATFAASAAELSQAVAAINNAIAAAIHRATAFILTLGLTEVFIKTDDGRVANQIPRYGGGGGAAETLFHASSFAENLANLVRIIEIIRQYNSTARVVFTVSPVPLSRTYTDEDVFSANLRSKSILVSAAREICDQHEGCDYFPSYEIVTAFGSRAFNRRDGRHVRPEIVNAVVDAFISAWFAD